MRHDYMTFRELFNKEIVYDYDPSVSIKKGVTTMGNMAIEIEYYTFNKLSLFPNGVGEYKGTMFTFEPSLWSKIEAFVELLQETKAEKVLYGQKSIK